LLRAEVIKEFLIQNKFDEVQHSPDVGFGKQTYFMWYLEVHVDTAVVFSLLLTLLFWLLFFFILLVNFRVGVFGSG
jgi:hypothetical protein